MRVEEIRKAHQARPFRPFTLRTSDGREYEVRHPEFLAMSPTGRTLVVADTDGTFDHIDVVHVTSIHFNSGRSRSRRRRKK